MGKILTTLLLAFFGLTILNAYAQETRFFMPSEIKQAYEKGTRSYDGKPGAKYWHNTVDYNIKVTIVPLENLIDGYEEVVYYNNSPDEIKTLVVRLYGDAYKKGNLRVTPINDKDIHNGVQLTDVTINSVSYDLDDWKMVQRRGTNITFTLEEPLKPGEELTFKASWKQKIPIYTKERTGVYDSTSFFVAYWYPQIAVFDDIFAWDKLDYNLLTEFYNNLGNYDVEITVPDDNIVWATGTLVNAKKVLSKGIYNRYSEARSSKRIVNIISNNDIEHGFKKSGNTWHYTASEVTDFAFALSDHYMWDATTLDIGNRQVLINSVYPIDTTSEFTDHIAMQQKSMQHFSEDIPGIPYPYESFTTFITKDGGGGMEYPMMANNARPGRGVTIHEMYHTYLPMYVRINERRWAWMDEGWATYNTALLENRFFENDHEIANVFSKVNPRSTMGKIVDLPLITSSQFLSWSNYGNASYSMPALVYAIIHQHMGEELFLNCYQEFIKRWAKKSPTPYDFFYTFEHVSGQDLGWLWKPWFFEFGTADLAIKSFVNDNLTVVNKGNKPVPLFVEVDYKNGDSLLLSKSAYIWADGNIENQVTIPKYENVERILVNTKVADENLIDNIFPSVESIYKNFDLSDDLLGQYRIEKYSFNISITQDDGILYFKTAWGMSMILYPLDNSNFLSLDGSMNIKFNLDETGLCRSIDFDWYGSVLKAAKLE